MNSPVVIFCYNRIEELRKSLEFVKRAIVSQQRCYYFFIDGPKHAADLDQITQVIKVINQFSDSGYDVNIVKREKNLGLRKNITSGLDEIFKIHDRAIILEDDIVVGHHFFVYMDLNLEKFEDNQEIAAINAWCPRNSIFSYYFENSLFQCWGWGTWSRVWQCYERDTDAFLKHDRHLLRMSFDKLYTQNFTEQLQQNFYGQKDTWAVYFAYMIWLNGLKCISPSKSLTRNIGFTNATNTFQEVDQPQYLDDLPKYDLRCLSKICQMSEWIYMFKQKVMSKISSLLK